MPSQCQDVWHSGKTCVQSKAERGDTAATDSLFDDCVPMPFSTPNTTAHFYPWGIEPITSESVRSKFISLHMVQCTYTYIRGVVLSADLRKQELKQCPTCRHWVAKVRVTGRNFCAVEPSNIVRPFAHICVGNMASRNLRSADRGLQCGRMSLWHSVLLFVRETGEDQGIAPDEGF